MKNVTGSLENWFVQQVSEEEFIIWGNVFNDERKRFIQGEFIRTSGIKNREVSEGDIVKTRNSSYLLGKRHLSIESAK